MNEVQLKLNEKGDGTFFIEEDGAGIGEMAFKIIGTKLTVFHTEVAEKAEGKGLARNMLNAMTGYAREHHLNVVPLCPYVHAQFKRHPQDYADIWLNEESNHAS